MKIPLILIAILLTTGCSSLSLFNKEERPPQIEIITKQVPVDIYQPPPPAPVSLEDVNWFVITEENLEEKITEIKNILGQEFVVFAMVPQSYENISYNVQELRRYIKEQQQIIIYYRTVTTKHQDINSDGVIDSKDWIEIQGTPDE